MIVALELLVSGLVIALMWFTVSFGIGAGTDWYQTRKLENAKKEWLEKQGPAQEYLPYITTDELAQEIIRRTGIITVWLEADSDGMQVKSYFHRALGEERAKAICDLIESNSSD